MTWACCAAATPILAGAAKVAFVDLDDTVRRTYGYVKQGTIRAHLIGVPARLARAAHRLVRHLPRDWPWEDGLDELFRHTLHDPLPITA
ncbi:hypothetical protein [Pseudonocardia asaccharolytica]|uniref:Transposase DDE domain-containing protein n=1 Tax=Pseudonocardia asaccharolytica DSM 44247 = NBRC 16224 TaxID=1123024 RepID=A0A511CX19_9PSEU|nr:hypothetical protein [Pseudonocardia asaccharolytica]GEL17092.1 hypothetical protein PA7_09290 [Pseudonocardia asaccharolytica DSM 44247 = NBRC 16224]